MGKKFEEKVKELEKQRKVGENRVYIPKVSGLRHILLFLAIAAVSFVLGRIFTRQVVVLMATNLISMAMVAYIAKILMDTQGSCVLMTNKRIYGQIGQREFSVFYHNIKNVYYLRKGIFIDVGNERDSVYLRHLANKDETYKMLIECIEKR